MVELNIPPQLILLTYNWLQDRTFTVTHRGYTTSVRQQKNGIPQGSSLSVLLWLLFVYDMPLEKKLSNIYVDDTEGWAVAPKKEEVSKMLSQQISTMEKWCNVNKIKINTEKRMSCLTKAQGLAGSAQIRALYEPQTK
ncbi:MAG: hypothetical protein RLZZ69_3341 [Cyanobacteriota bacterium]